MGLFDSLPAALRARLLDCIDHVGMIDHERFVSTLIDGGIKLDLVVACSDALVDEVYAARDQERDLLNAHRN